MKKEEKLYHSAKQSAADEDQMIETKEIKEHSKLYRAFYARTMRSVIIGFNSVRFNFN